MFGEGYGGVYLLRVAREQDELVLRWRDPVQRVGQQGWEESWAETERKILDASIQEFRVAYRADWGEPWQSSWREQTPPAAVRFQLKSRDRFWPELIMSVPR